MNIFKKVIEFLTRMKDIDIWGDRNEGLTEDDIEYLDSLPTQNPYGMAGVMIGGFTFLFPQYGFSIITLIFCIVTFFTFFDGIIYVLYGPNSPFNNLI